MGQVEQEARKAQRTADEAGVSRISERSEKKLTPAEEQAAKKAAFAAKQAKAAEQGLFPDVALPKLPF